MSFEFRDLFFVIVAAIGAGAVWLTKINVRAQERWDRAAKVQAQREARIRLGQRRTRRGRGGRRPRTGDDRS